MKKIIRSITTVALMFIVSTSMAKEPTLRVTDNTEKSLVFEMDAPSGKTVISILDIDGAIIYSEQVANVATYSKKFDLRNLPNGDYTLKVEEMFKETIFAFDIDNAMVILEERKENAKPVFKKNGQKVLLNLLNKEMGEVSITIYDSENRVVFSETIVDTLLVQKAFNFEKAYKDNYMMVVKNGKNSFFENIEVK